MFQQTFFDTVSNYTNNTDYTNQLFYDIAARYSGPERHYHTLKHLDHLTQILTEVKDRIIDWDGVVFSIAYHDSIYDTSKQDNEEQSAAYVVKKLSGLISDKSLEKCRQMILATKNHLPSEDSDVNYFTDADLSILGTNPEAYSLYTHQIREEYKDYPDQVYIPGRQRVLRHFLEMKSIYKTDYFHNKYEAQARKNMEDEMNELKRW